jgi:starch synthase (maltosyl-transferring)
MELNQGHIGSPLIATCLGGTDGEPVNIPSIGVRAGRRILIEDIYPSIEQGRFAVKRIVGEPVDVWADILRDGNAVLAAELLWRLALTGKWFRTAMRPRGDDRWSATFTPSTPGRYEYAIEAWTDVFGTWRRDVLAKREAGLDVGVETLEGRRILAGLKPRTASGTRLIDELSRNADTAGLDALLADDIAARPSRS